ncbi:exocyst complex component protein [Arthroderma uncinatum]|uniref:exocyst complex component protein n=1 Tax=Arthroderma uncinatum TaxID=74035 RepID=UPI00144AE0C4|nr:exocyst complex component protein [Arthroderma uncinatum]KAF3481943.1 exocyst complex component protein [Arthroderma uncinatum]
MPDQSHQSDMRRSIFNKGPNFTLETFSNRDFIVKDFIESLSDAAIQRRSGGIGNQPFDPKPLIRAFEHAQRRLTELSGDLEQRENELSAAVRKAEAQHTQNASNLGWKLNQAIESFQKLDTSLNGPRRPSTRDGPSSGNGNVAVETGKKLEELDRQRRKALDAHFLIGCWDEVSNRGELTMLENLRRSGSGEGKVRSARIARQLLRISQRLDPLSWSENNGGGENIPPSPGDHSANGNGPKRRNTREIIEKFSETLEKDLLKQFDHFYRKANFEGMKDCASVLHDFNGGASVIALFVNQHQFFIDRSQLISEEVSGDSEAWEQLADPDAESPGAEPSLQSLVDEVQVVVQEESAIIKRAFPYYEQVLSKFLQRVFQQSIQQRLELVLDKASSVSSLAFLRTLQSARSYISALVDDLKAHGLTEHPDTMSSQTAIFLDQQLEELFIPYLMGSSYIEREKNNLEELYTSLMFKFVTFHSRRKKTPTTFMSSLAKSGSELLASARDAYINSLDSSDFTPTQRKMLLRVAGLKENGELQKQNEIELTEEDGQLSVAFAKRMLRWLAEGVGRSLELSVSSETPKDVSTLLNMLLSRMGEGYIEMALDASLDSAHAQESGKAEPDFNYLTTLRTAISVTYLMMTCINAVLVPLAASNITIKRDMEKKTNLIMHRIEEKINSIEQKTVDVTLAWVARVLSGQKKNDFRPKEGVADETGWLEMLQTPTCASISGFLTRLHNITLTSLPSSGSNVRIFLTEIALGTRALLLDHFKKFPVNAPGGLMVTKDMTRYTELLRSWNIDEAVKGVGGALDVLLEVGSLFVIGPQALKERVRAGTAGGSSGASGGAAGSGGTAGGSQGKSNAGLSVQEVRAYVLRREDSGSVAMQGVFNAF